MTDSRKKLNFSSGEKMYNNAEKGKEKWRENKLIDSGRLAIGMAVPDPLDFLSRYSDEKKKKSECNTGGKRRPCSML